MSDELFSPSEVAKDSPRVAWMKRHDIAMLDLRIDVPARKRWRARSGGYVAFGPDEDTALIDLAEMLDIADWREENL